MLFIFKQLKTHFIGDYVLIGFTFDKIKFVFVFYLYMVALLNPLIANESKDYYEIDMLVFKCYKDKKFCSKALFKINEHQKNAAINRKFSCQTRLLGLEANLIMASNSNFKRKEAKSILHFIKKYC